MLRFAAIAVVLALAAIAAFAWEQADFQAPGPLARDTIVLIAPGNGVSGIAQALEQSGAVRNGELFKWGVRLRGDAPRLKAGEYEIPAYASEEDIADILMSGKSVQHKLTAAEGLTSAMIFDLVRHDPVLVGDAGTPPPEGSLLPETYLFTRGTTRAEILARMRRAQQKFLAAQWAARTPGLPLRSPEDALILASIVEKETALPAERRHIASVFVNRIRLGMKLQSDPTIIYGITRGYPLGRGIRQSELARATAYNTYAIAGLPPTPICDPGKDAIAAVLDPANTHDLYFVADGTGGHVFSDNIAEHERNVAKWRRIESGHP